MSKIDKQLLQLVVAQKNTKLNCVVYTEDFFAFKTQILPKFEHDGEKTYQYPFINAFGLKLDQSQIVKLAKTSVVSFISKQSRVFAQINVSKKILQTQNFYDMGVFGSSCTIAIIDTGINPHLDFVIPKNRIIKFVDLINNKVNPYDDNGHGTFVASIACGNGLISNKKYSGIAPNAKIISIKALEDSGETGAFKILEAMQWVYDNRKKYNIRVVCMSFGSTPIDKNDPMMIGAESLWQAGIVVVAAAGNSGPKSSTIKSPGISNKIITVGGLDDKRIEDKFDYTKFGVAEFSSRGPAGYFYKPDLIAPAINITGANFKGGYTQMSGTSVATPMIAGVCCLIIDKFPQITPDQIKVRLVKNCKQIVYNQNAEGYGLLQLNGLFK